MVLRQGHFGGLLQQTHIFLILATILCLLVSSTRASYGDRLPEFRDCIEVCKRENCVIGGASIPLIHRLFLWDCPSECDYACQHIITDKRVAASLPIVQFHGKWPFHRFLGMQEPFSVLFSLFNLLAHHYGLRKVSDYIPSTYPLRIYYIHLAYLNMAAWTFSMIFHTRDFIVTEQMDYFAAGAVVLYGLYYTPIRIYRLDLGEKSASTLRIWRTLCIFMYVAHATYLKWYSWDYSYNMTANVVVGIIQNAMWTWYSVQKYRKSKRPWTVTPGLIVAWVLVVMSLELLDFPPIGGCIDAHSLWHLGTVAPAIVMYNFLVKDAKDDIAGQRLKA